MLDNVRGLFSGASVELTPYQKDVYANETLNNFRHVAKLAATRSSYTLTSANLASPELNLELAELGQFSELAYNILPVETVYENLEIMMKPYFPLEGCDGLLGSKLLKPFVGAVAGLHGFTAYRPTTKQLVIAISGTKTAKQALYDVRSSKTAYPNYKGCAVHTGFWKLYKGWKDQAISAIQAALREYSAEIQELVITGHSMGGAIGYLLALDLLLEKEMLPEGLTIKLAFFGAPRVGNKNLSLLWRELVREYRKRNGEHSFKEYCVKGYNDGVPSVPPCIWGFRHFTETPIYLSGGRLYHIPAVECEHGLFDVSVDPEELKRKPQYPRGGHNYYNDRDMEKSARRMEWLGKLIDGEPDWEERYRQRVIEHEEKRRLKIAKAIAKVAKAISP